MMKHILSLFLFSAAAVAGFYPVNRGMINQGTVGTVAGSTVTFVATSNQVYIAEGGVSGATYKFPDARNLPKDWWYKVINNSSGSVTASDNLDASIAIVTTGREAYFHLTDSTTQAGTWKYNVPAAPGDIITDHGLLTGLGDDDHTQYHNDTRGDARYYQKTEHINAGAGAADAGKPIVLNASGVVDATMLPGGGGLASVGQVDFGSPALNGATVSGSELILQSAKPGYPGLVSDSAQTFTGAKTFTDGITSSVIGNITGNVSGDITGNLTGNVTGNVTGNADTATALAANPTNCTAGNYPLGIDASGNVENCTAAGGGGNSPTSIGTIDSQAKSADGLVTSSTVLYAQTADASFPGMVSTSTQTFGGNKTFNGTVNLNTVTASRFLFGSSAKNVTSSLVNLADTTNHVTGIAGVANGGLGISSTPSNGQIPIGNGTNYVAATITAGSGITVTNSAGAITINSTSSGGSSSISYNYVFLETGAGHGSTNTKVRRFSAVRETVGSTFTVTQSATLGDKVTVGTAGTFVICHGDVGSAGPVHSGLVINGAAGTTSVLSLTYADGVRTAGVANGALSMTSCWAGTLAANDYFWLQDNAAADGTATTTWLAAAKVSAANESNIYVQNGLLHGGTNNKIRTFTNIRSNNGGSDISYATSATNGDSFTVNTAGNYMVCYSDGYSGGVLANGVSLNDTLMTTAAGSSTYFAGMRSYAVAGTIAAGTAASCYTDYFKVGDILRAHDDGLADSADVSSYFFITKMGNTTDPTGAYLNDGNGVGSSNTKTRKYTTIAKTIGGNENKSAIEGDTIYSADAGIHIACISDQTAAGTAFGGVALNLSDATTSATVLTYASGLRGVTTTGVNNTTSAMCVPLYVPAGGRAYHVTNGTNTATTFRSYFAMKRIY